MEIAVCDKELIFDQLHIEEINQIVPIDFVL